MKSVLCFGDSNTWGYDPEATALAPAPRRHGPSVRWTGVLASLLGPDWRVVEEGQNGRTTHLEDPLAPHRNGSLHLPACLESHKPLDAVVLLLGTNNLKACFRQDAEAIAAALGRMADVILTSNSGPDDRAPRLLLVCPAAVGPFPADSPMAERFAGAEATARELPQACAAMAAARGIAFLDLQPVVSPSPVDGIHFDAAGHQLIGGAVAEALRSLCDRS